MSDAIEPQLVDVPPNGGEGVDGSGHRVRLMGLDLDALSQLTVVDRVVASAARKEGGCVLTPNLELLRQYVSRPEVRRHFAKADLVVADGMPLIWASRLAGTPLPERVAGSDLIWTVSGAAASRSLSVFLLGGDTGVAQRAGVRLQEEFPGLRTGWHFPPYGYDRDATALREIEDRLAESLPDIVYVGLPFPKQAELVERLRPRFPTVWFLCVGVSFSFVTGDVPRAPVPLQRLGLEWVWRLVQEPRRLFARYVLDGLPFAVRLGWWGLGARLRASRWLSPIR